MNTRRPARRRGYTLLELVLVVGSVAVLVGLCGTLLQALFKLDRAGRSAAQDAATLGRLARQFRRDARAAADARPSAGKGGAPRLELTAEGGPAVTYRLDGDRLLREETAGGAVRAREGYAVGRLGPLTFRSERGRVRMTLARHPAGARGPDRPAVEVEATLGKDRRPARPEGDRP